MAEFQRIGLWGIVVFAVAASVAPNRGMAGGKGDATGMVREFRMPMYAPHSTSAVAVLHIKDVSRGHQRRGFFRIGALPMVIASDVTIEILEVARLPETSLSHKALAARLGGKVLEMRRVTLLCGNTVVKANTMRSDNQGRWRFNGQVEIQQNGSVARSPEATLEVGSLHCGRLSWTGTNSCWLPGASRTDTGQAVTTLPP